MTTKSKAPTGQAFAVIKTGGKQYKVEEGMILQIEKISAAEDGKITFEEVLLVDDGKETKVGAPHVSGVKVTGVILRDGRHKKIDVVKYMPKSRYFKKNGHRQPFTEVKIESIGA